MQVCRQLSEGSQRATHFYELDVQVKGYATLEKSLVRFLVSRDVLPDSLNPF